MGDNHGNARGSGSTTERGEADTRRTARRRAGGGNPIPPLPPAVVPDGSASAGEHGRRGRRAAGRTALGVSQSKALRGAVAGFDVADAHRDQRRADAAAERGGASGGFAGANAARGPNARR